MNAIYQRGMDMKCSLMTKDCKIEEECSCLIFVNLFSISNMVGEGSGNSLKHSCLENPMDGGAWKAAVHGVAEGWTRLSDFTFTFPFHALEKEMATHSSVLAWRIPGTGEPAGLPSLGSHRVRHDWSDLAAAALLLIFYSVDTVKSYLYLLKPWNIANHRFAQSQLKIVYLFLQ